MPAFWLLCPYDSEALGPDVLEEAGRSHPFVSERGIAWQSAGYRGLEQAAEPFAAPPPERDGGRGLWMVNRLCDLVQLRGFPDGAAVRVHMYLP